MINYEINNFNFFMPVEIVFGRDCVIKNKNKFGKYKKIFIVSGKSSAKISGALSDMLEIFNETKADFYIFDKITENPLLSVCYEGGREAKLFGADLIVGIGGGSPMDAAKAAAMFAANPRMNPEDLFEPELYKNPPPDFFAIPTTSGTGSEANPYSVITLDGQDLKKTFNYAGVYAKTAFLDPKYTIALPHNITVGTALDALCHCIESRLSVKSTPVSEIYANSGIRLIYRNLKKLIDLKVGDNIDYSIREELMLGSFYGGVAINTTGTGFPHPMGYNLTLINGLPHGFACALFIGEFLELHKNIIKPETLGSFGDNLDNIKNTVKILIDYYSDFNEKFSDETLRFYSSRIKTAKNFTNSIIGITGEEEIFKIYKKCVGV
ncbi:MAG: iron-containing alcohol dehydrogenase [Oscillospiraceae bacterium]|nr:iron-containing alcohol dehydrogenase [Oscillospiraceae bacterium]